MYRVTMSASGLRPAWGIGLAIACWAVSLVLGCWAGPSPASLGQVCTVLLAKMGLIAPTELDPTLLLVIGDIRFARVFLALLCGGALAVAGIALQGVLHNTLADPFTLGISAGAACGASLVLGVGGGWLARMGGMVSSGAVSAAAFAGALLALFLALLLGRGKGLFARETVILAGIAVATFLGAVVALVKALNEESVTSIVFWVMGSLQGRTWDALPMVLVPLLVGLTLVASHWRELDMLALGDVQAAQMGVPVARTRLLLLVGASCMTAGCVAVAGVIGFVGLVVPHILRQCIGAAHGALLVAAWFGGGVLLLWADVIARVVLSGGQELPVGVVTALLGGPFFALLIRARG
jgi:iron complex transport system permease protein